jgi:hypothetical protein
MPCCNRVAPELNKEDNMKPFEKKTIKETSRHTDGRTWAHVHDGGVTITTNVPNTIPYKEREIPYKDHDTFDNNGNPA